MLDRLKPNPGSRRPRKRVGRGVGCGSAKTSGRGTKGAGARAGRKHRPHREGGQIPIVMRMPKRGFRSQAPEAMQIVNVGALGEFAKGSVVDATTLADAGLVRSSARPVKLLGAGDLGVGLTLRVAAASASAKQKVEAAGGQLEIVSP